ncbi:MULTISPECIES: glycosyltransferase family 2 protein [unclassified Chelatococcus]|uniref:glycosyltransferase family 2 protein n=1 Tax=unclassified Chelatococcus TaxID=2638111 RepID=UPI001BCE16CF|nr:MULTISPECIES: glycosyltransferase family 2 protein [unclassified Chelatococcus]CAH1648062.1 Glycosyltransferase involved in cell wall biosynthesis [Hyphomicrobiales bacterium]MBS7742080.1 glycosyltransferase [Chelatococcus sp. HY11]MBX3541122.1 glycosyltransferase [Chelatococcus sp.]MCO5074983.1 glycosyltransferase family 2 protein [Chelatococcus sp.]CAH1690288.1 Glycosyltransferase involved in cell wall biosynthesis [Hyphomicrobiales bacterium]
MSSEPRIAVLVPCYNEAASIDAVVRDFRASLPQADIFVYDNNSTDDTVAIATAAGAIVRTEPRQGKGFVVRRMFADVDADVYVIVDGDDTYDAASAPRLVELVLKDNCDLVNGARVPTNEAAFRAGHKFGNKMLSALVSMIFGKRNNDMLSGYKALSRRMVKSFPIKSSGFEIETELLIHVLELGLPVAEIKTPYRERGEGSESKLRTYRDGFRIIWLISHLIRDEKPLQFFAAVAAILALVAIALGVPVVVTFAETGLVPRLPTALLATGLVISSLLALTAGLVLDSVARARREFKLLSYLGLPAPAARRR